MFGIGRLLSGGAQVASLLGAICIVVMMLHVTADVVGRYLFNTPVTGTIVVVGHYYMIVVVFLALGVAEEKNAHISVEVLTDRMPKSVQGCLSVLSGLLTIAVFSLLVISGYSEAMKKTKSGAAIENGAEMIPIWQSYWAIPIGAGLIVLIAAYRVVTKVSGAQSGLNETSGNEEIMNE